MSDTTAPVEGADATTVDTDGEAKRPDVEKQAFLDRLNKESEKRKAADARASKLEQDLAEIRAAMEERENQGLPELDRERKAREQLEKRLEEAEKRAAASEQAVARTQREQWVAQAASQLNFANPARAARLIDDLDSIEDADQAERAVKRLAKSDPYLVKPADSGQPKIGRVLENGQQVTPGQAKRRGRIDPEAEAQTIADGLKQFTQQWQSVGQ